MRTTAHPNMQKHPTGTLQHDISLVDDGIARLTAMLRHKEREHSPGMRVVGTTLSSPRAKAAKGQAWKPGMTVTASLHSEPTLRA